MAEYRCQECGATFNSQAEREQHNRMVHSLYTCDECGEVFDSEKELEAHEGVMHPEQQRQKK